MAAVAQASVKENQASRDASGLVDSLPGSQSWRRVGAGSAAVPAYLGIVFR